MLKPHDTRREPRIRVRNLQVKIGCEAFNVFNLSSHGVGFLLDCPGNFKVGSELDKMTLEMDSPISLSGTTRHITHISEIDDDADVRCEWICGVEFEAPADPEQLRELQDSIETYLEAAAA